MRENPNYYYNDYYKPKMICCTCRKVFKRRLAADIGIADDGDDKNMKCPNCGDAARYVGPKFRAPASKNIAEWKSLKVLTDIGALPFIGFANVEIEIPSSSKRLNEMLENIKEHCEYCIERWLRDDYNEEKKRQIRIFSDVIKSINQHIA